MMQWRLATMTIYWWSFLLLLAGSSCSLHSCGCHGFVIVPKGNSGRVPLLHGGRPAAGSVFVLYDSSTTSASSRRRTKKTVVDRSPEEAIALVQDILRSIQAAGPRAGPQRTLQAYRAVSQTLRDIILSSSEAAPWSVPKILRTLFERMGATYIKLGQFIASSPTLFPNDYVVEFQKCLDATEAVPWSTMKKILDREFAGNKQSLSSIFSYIDPKPLATASIAQVHVAKLRETGEDVVLKIQKPGIEDCLQADLGFIFVAARILEFIQPDWERTSLSAVAGDIRASMLEEVNFLQEAQNIQDFRDFLVNQELTKQATAPRVYPEYTTKKVLTMERLRGVSLLDETSIQKVTADPTIGTQAIITALNIWSMSVVNMPFFHADVHAGNLLLLQDGRVGFIDFGIVGRVSEKTFAAVNQLSLALAMNDYVGMAQALCDMGATDDSVNIDQFAQDLKRVVERMTNTVETADVTITANMDEGTLQGALEIDESDITNLVLDLVNVTEDNGLKLPREFGLLVKQSLYFDRYLKILAPNVDVMNDSRIAIGGNFYDSKDNNQNPNDVVIDA